MRLNDLKVPSIQPGPYVIVPLPLSIPTYLPPSFPNIILKTSPLPSHY